MNCAWTPHFFFEWDGKAESNGHSLIPLIESPYFKVTYIHLELPGQQSKVQNLNHRFTISMTFSHRLLAFSAACSSFPFGSISNCDVVLLQEAPGLKDIKPDLGWGLLMHAMLWCSCPALSKWRERGCKKSRSSMGFPSILCLAIKGKTLKQGALKLKSFSMCICHYQVLFYFISSNSVFCPNQSKMKMTLTKSVGSCSVLSLGCALSCNVFSPLIWKKNIEYSLLHIRWDFVQNF